VPQYINVKWDGYLDRRLSHYIKNRIENKPSTNFIKLNINVHLISFIVSRHLIHPLYSLFI
jgi:hypothetical protein